MHALIFSNRLLSGHTQRTRGKLGAPKAVVYPCRQMIPSDPYGEIQMLLAGLPDSAGAIVAKSRDFRDSGDVDFAYELLRQALEQDPAPILRAELADALASDGRYIDGEEQALIGLQADPNSRLCHRALERCLLEREPVDVLHLAEVALRFADLNPDLTEDLLQKAIDAFPQDVVLREQLAQFYGEQRRVVDCIAALQGLLAIEPEHDEAALMLAAAYMKQGDFPRAQKILNRTRKRGVASPMLDTLEAKLGAIMKTISQARNS